MNQKTKKPWQLVMLLTLDLALLILISSICAEKAQAMCLGCSGERVAAVQRRLSEMDIYSGNADGEYDFSTRSAVKKFQQARGINSTGETDFETLRAMGLNARSDLCFSFEVELLARCIHQSNCQSYPQMLQTALDILESTQGTQTLGNYAAENFPSLSACPEPSSQAYAAAVQAILTR